MDICSIQENVRCQRYYVFYLYLTHSHTHINTEQTMFKQIDPTYFTATVHIPAPPPPPLYFFRLQLFPSHIAEVSDLADHRLIVKELAILCSPRWEMDMNRIHLRANFGGIRNFSSSNFNFLRET